MIRNPIIRNLGWVFTIILTGIPLFMWLLMNPLTIRFGSRYAQFISIGQISGLIGGMLFAISLILSGRFRVTELFFGGMNRVYIAHHIIGGLAFIFLMIHPLILIVPRAMISLNNAALFLVPGKNLSDTLGIISLSTLMLLLILTYYVKLKFNVWKFTHKFLGISFFFGFLHSFFVESDISLNMPLRVYMIGTCSFAIIVYTYRTLLGKWIVPKYLYTVETVTPLSEGIIKVILRPVRKAIKYRAGQFIFIQFSGTTISSEWHPFSLSSYTEDGSVEIIIKALGDYTKQLLAIQPGSAARIEGPYGEFYEADTAPHQIWVAGGIGITPFLSMARKLDSHVIVLLFYVVHDNQEAVEIQTLIEISRLHPNFKLCLFDSSQLKTHITATIIEATSGGLKGQQIYICGPVPMMKSLTNQLRSLKVPKSSIHTEEFAML